MNRRIIDISVAISPDMSVYPGDPQPSVENIFSIDSDGFEVSKISLGTHTGTHIDAPSHVIKGGASIDELPLEHFYGRAIVFDLSSISTDVSASDLDDYFERSHICDGATPAILLLKTIGHLSELHISKSQNKYIGFDETVGQWIRNSQFKTVGVDVSSIDADPSLPNHKLLLQNNVCIIENLDLAEIDEGIYEFICFPLNLVGCDASPARAVLIEL